MLRLRFLPILLLVGLLSLHLNASTVVFDNFGPGDTYDTVTGATLGRADPHNTQGFAFVPSAGGLLETLELAAGLVDPPNELNVWLMTDNSGEPGAEIESFTLLDAMGAFGAANPPIVIPSVLQPLLSLGTTYWLIASAPPEAWAAWNYNSIGDTGGRASSTNGIGGPWGVSSSSTRGAFRVTVAGNPIPEPGSFSLALTGLVILGGCIIRRRR